METYPAAGVIMHVHEAEVDQHVEYEATVHQAVEDEQGAKLDWKESHLVDAYAPRSVLRAETAWGLPRPAALATPVRAEY